MNDKSLLRTGAIGTIIAAICCFTPALVILLGAVGLSAWLSWLDFVLLPALTICIGILGFALVRLAKKRGQNVSAGEPL